MTEEQKPFESTAEALQKLGEFRVDDIQGRVGQRHATMTIKRAVAENDPSREKIFQLLAKIMASTDIVSVHVRLD